jgi:2-polyprenyl-3-methyl-5-hydroxy-6-metoxy-1,4-benzoquinol methylase
MTCDICGAGMRVLYPAAADYLTGDSFAVWRCEGCGSGRTQPVPAAMSPYYPARYRRYNRVIARVLALLYRRRARRWAGMFAAPGSVFEMGCGDGLMLESLRRMGWQVLGLERTEAAAGAARQAFGIPVVAGGLDEIPADARFDLILLFQVLEHLDDPAPVLAFLAARLNPGGRLVAAVPNFASWQAWFGGAGWFHLDVPRHLRHFSATGLRRLMGDHGLRVVRVSYLSPEHDPYGWVQSLLNRVDSKPNRLTRLLMREDAPGAINLLHLAAGCVIGVMALPVSLASWVLRRGALIEVTCVRR